MISPLRRWGKVNFWSVYMYFLMRLDSITATWLHSIWEGRWLVAVASATITIVLPVRALTCKQASLIYPSVPLTQLVVLIPSIFHAANALLHSGSGRSLLGFARKDQANAFAMVPGLVGTYQKAKNIQSLRSTCGQFGLDCDLLF